MADRIQLHAAQRALEVLRSMRGAAGKVAQLADFVEVGWAPVAERAALQAGLDELRLGTPEPLPFKRIERVLRDAWGGKVADHLADIDPDPAAMASAGQVHRAELDDGRAVAVKVLHPGAEEALRADLGNLSLLAQLATTVAPALDPRRIAAELRERTLEEMDLEHEAQAQRAFARAYRGHPLVWVPAPITGLSRTSVLVSEWVDGMPFERVVELDAEARDRYGEILVRFHAGAMLHLGVFHADPHPHNHRLLADGRVAFMDFGAVGRAEPAWLAGLLDAAEAVEEGDGRRLADGLAALGYLVDPERVDRSLLVERARAGGARLLGDAPVRIDAALGSDVLDVIGPAQDELMELLALARLPARDLQAGRMIAGLGLVLARLRASAPWGAIGRESLGTSTPATALGEQGAAFWAGRGHSREWAVRERRGAA